jgi:lipopolysaccharide transport system permease protein
MTFGPRTESARAAASRLESAGALPAAEEGAWPAARQRERREWWGEGTAERTTAAGDGGPRLRAALRELVRHRELLWSLTAREILVRYKQAALGVAWAILQPLVLMIVFAIFFGIFCKVPSEGLPYTIFFYLALVPWMFFSTALSFAVHSLSGNAYLISKVSFPREVLPLASVLAAGIDFLIGAVLLVAMLLLYHIPLTWYALWIFPLFGVQVVFTIAISLVLSAVNVRYRDVRYVLPLLMQVWLYVSPVMYPVSVVPERLRFFYLLNPMAALIDGYRRSLGHGMMPRGTSLLIATAVSIVLLLLSYRSFKRAERAFADVI